MKTLLFFIAAQLAGNGITLLIAASLAHLLRRRLLRDLGAYTAGIATVGGPYSLSRES